MNKFIDQVSSVEMPDFEQIYEKVSRRLMIRRVVLKSIAALVIIAVIVSIPKDDTGYSEEIFASADDQFEFAEYDPLASLFE